MQNYVLNAWVDDYEASLKLWSNDISNICACVCKYAGTLTGHTYREISLFKDSCFFMF